MAARYDASADIIITALRLCGTWAQSLKEIEDMFPAISLDTPRREPTLLPPPLPVREQMNEYIEYRRSIDFNLRLLRLRATTG
ncbi:hypothetical protein IL306_005767 [Fusarium sp. DS 682]|nr:hypothetical protein IL306_005767 [Fusarium sp. DS 682]